MYSLFEEQIQHNSLGSSAPIDDYENSFSEAASSFPTVDMMDMDLDRYLGQLQELKAAVESPVDSFTQWYARG